MFIMILIHESVAIGAYCVFKAKRLDELGMTFFTSTSMLGGAFYFVLFTWKNGKVLKLIKKYNEFIEQSELLCTFAL